MPTPAERRPRQQYRRPSVHEVVLDVAFGATADQAAMAPVPDLLRAHFGSSRRLENTMLEVVSGSALPETHASVAFAGWVFETEGYPKWAIRAQLERLTMNMVRSERWPTGDYVGWDSVIERFDVAYQALRPIYGQLPPRRVGLRYLNRFAVPASSALEEWLTIGVVAPDTLQRPYSFLMRQTWETIADHDGVSATINLATVATEGAPESADPRRGVLLDIDVFNLRPQTAPDYAGIPAWLRAAHDAENVVFESCITDRLRAIFDET